MPHTSTFLVDDSPSFLQSAARFLAADERIEIVGVALSAAEALSEVARIQPALVLIDFNMPGMNGLEATRLLKNLPNPPHVVVLTLHDTQEYRQAALQAQADGFVAKSDFGQKLLPSLEAFLSRGTASDSAPNGAAGSSPSEAAPLSAMARANAFGLEDVTAVAPSTCAAPGRGHSIERAPVLQGGLLREVTASDSKFDLRRAKLPLPPLRQRRRRGAGMPGASLASGRRVLLAEDQVPASHLMAVNMWRAGIETRIAPDAISALELFESFDPHLVVMSATSPRVRALSVSRSIRARSDVPILLITEGAAGIVDVCSPRQKSASASGVGLEWGSELLDVEEVISRPGDVSVITARVLSLLGNFYSNVA